jgi:membrane protein implicated in regulation of membrane protease activity
VASCAGSFVETTTLAQLATRNSQPLLHSARLALLVYSATAVLLLWLVHRFVQPLSRFAALFLFLVPFALAGERGSPLAADGPHGKAANFQGIA